MKYINKNSLKLSLYTLKLFFTKLLTLNYVEKALSHMQIDCSNIGEVEINPQENYIIIGNHRSIIDTIVILKYLFSLGIIRISAFSKSNIIYKGVLNILTSRVGSSIVDIRDKNAARKAIKELQNGKHFMFFPEGTRNRTPAPLLPFKKGVDFLIRKSKRKIILFYIEDSDRVLKDGIKNVRIEYSVIALSSYGDKTIEQIYREIFADKITSSASYPQYDRAWADH
jgi:1-acyl-sn-glycerol-3-phosphate acyltransferase|tara:strand:+ start:11557 stop:12234 length:678 start_codon:yes stop_codon:yes gene_type:complete